MVSVASDVGLTTIRIGVAFLPQPESTRKLKNSRDYQIMSDRHILKFLCLWLHLYPVFNPGVTRLIGANHQYWFAQPIDNRYLIGYSDGLIVQQV